MKRPDRVMIAPGRMKPVETIKAGKDVIPCDVGGVYYTHGARWTKDDYKPYRHSVDEKGRGFLIRKDEPDLYLVRDTEGNIVSPRTAKGQLSSNAPRLAMPGDKSAFQARKARNGGKIVTPTFVVERRKLGA